MLQSCTHLQLDGFIALWNLYKPQAMNDPIPAYVKPSAPLHVRETRFRQSPCTALSPRNPFPSNPVRLSLAAKSVSVTPCACACPSPRSPCSVRLLVCRREARFRLPPCFAFPSSQSIGPVPHRFHAASGNTLIAVSDCKGRCTTTETATGECATATRTGRSCPAARWSSYKATPVGIHRGDEDLLLPVFRFVSCSRLPLD